MLLDKYRVDGNKHVKISDFPTDSKKDDVDKAKIVKLTEKNQEKIAALQDKLYADGKEGVIIVLQAMDAAGKDSTIKHVMSGINPQGVKVTSFKQPNSTELAHDYLWRVNQALPRRGMMAIFNRSYYEDVLVVKVHDLYKKYNMAKRTVNDGKADFFAKRLRQISNYEEYLYDNSYRIVKIFLHVSPEEQKKRFLERIDDKTKNWKFSATDLTERAYWKQYMDAYEDAINGTASGHSPWFVVPADQKWYTRYLVSEAVVEALEACNPQYPTLDKQSIEHLDVCKAELLADKGMPDSPKKAAATAAKIEKAAAEAKAKKAAPEKIETAEDKAAAEADGDSEKAVKKADKKADKKIKDKDKSKADKDKSKDKGKDKEKEKEKPEKKIKEAEVK